MNGSETFFRPSERRQEESTLPAYLFNLCRRLLGRARRGCVFVPIRTMQYLAVIDGEEVIFVDSQGGYQVFEGEGGRLIKLAWRFPPPASRESLTEPVAVAVVHYAEGLADVQRRLIGEFGRAMRQLDERRKDSAPFEKGARVVSLTPRKGA